MTPTQPKVMAAGLGGSLATLIMAIAHSFGYPLPPGAEGAIATVAAFLLGWLKAS